MRTKTLIIAAAALAAYSPASAATWVKVAKTSTGSVIYIDSTSVTYGSDYVDAWFRSDQSADATKKTREVKELLRFRCKARQMATVSVTAYRANGSVDFSNTTNELLLSFEPIVPDTVGEDMAGWVCP